MRHHAHISIGVEIARCTCYQKFAHIADVFGAADRRTARHAHTAVCNAFVTQQARIRQGLFRRIDTQVRYAPHASELLARPVFGRRIAFNRRAQLRFQFRKASAPVHVFDRVFFGFKGRLNTLPITAESGNTADTCYNDSSGIQHKPPFTAIT